MEATSKAMTYYEKFFGYKFPFEKYDIVMCTEYNWGAMENVGVVTFTDFYVRKSRPSESMLVRRTQTTVHELAHMWFGNLVTMNWWDNLWLKESFAVFTAHFCMDKINNDMTEPIGDIWTAFLKRKADTGYPAD